MEQKAPLTASKLPLWTLATAFFAVLIFVFPQLGVQLVYDRAAIIHGEIWRLFSGNFVHFSLAHLCYNLAAWFITGSIIELRGYRFFPALCLLSSIIIGMIIFMLAPELNLYAGLSGIVSSAVTYLCLHGIGEKGIWRWLCSGMLAGLIAKTVIEMVTGSSMMLLMSEENFVPVPLSHLAGIVTAFIFFVFLRMSSYFRHYSR